MDHDEGEWERRHGSIDFEPVSLAEAAASDGKTPLVSPDYEYDVLIPWGTPLKSGINEYTGDPSYRPAPSSRKTWSVLATTACTFSP